MMKTNSMKPYLTAADLAVLTLIFFGTALVSSTWGFMYPDPPSADGALFDSRENWFGIAYEIILLAAAFAYLKWKKFDFSVLDFSVGRKTPFRIIAYFLSAGLVASIADYGVGLLAAEGDAGDAGNPAEPFRNPLAEADISLILFALLNGFFEEVYFLGLLFAVRGFTRHMRWIFLFGLLMRFLLHTYQELWSAAIVTTLGAVFFWLRRKNSRLVPFMLAHSLFDILGLGLPFYLLYRY